MVGFRTLRSARRRQHCDSDEEREHCEAPPHPRSAPSKSSSLFTVSMSAITQDISQCANGACYEADTT